MSQSKSAVGRQELIWVLLGIVALGSYVRLLALGDSAFRADTILLLGLAQRQVPPWLVLTKWFEVSGAAGQMPMPAFAMQAFLFLFDVPTTAFWVRFPFAVFGILGVVAAFFAGGEFKGRYFGLLLAAMVALNPFHVYLSREAYFYSAAHLGYFLYFWAAVAIAQRLQSRQALLRRDYVVLAGALFFCGYSQMSGLMICAVGFVMYSVLICRGQWQSTDRRNNIIGLVAAHVIVFFPFLFTAWGPREMIVQFLSGQSEEAKQAVAVYKESMLLGLAQSVCRMTWGTAPGGLLLMTGSLAAGIVGMVRERRRLFLMMLYFVAAQLALFIATKSMLGVSTEARYLSGMFPFMLALSGYGIFWICQAALRLHLASWLRHGICGLVCAVPLIAWVYPSYVVTQLTGKPTPYYDVVQWTDSQLPRGTLVAVDRWLEPWNELKYHPSTNVIFTFTVPNWPAEAYNGNRWRDSMKSFFRRFPDAAYLEMVKCLWEDPEIGPWDWPRTHFRQHVIVRNEPGLELRRLGLAARGGFYAANTNRLAVEIFYNTTEDLIQIARDEGRTSLLLYGPTWGHAKPWQQLRGPMRFHDWRVLNERATIDVHNFGDTSIEARLVINAFAAGANKRVEANGQAFVFRGLGAGPGGLSSWEIGPIELSTGRNVITLVDSSWRRRQVPLLVGDVRLVVADTLPER